MKLFAIIDADERGKDFVVAMLVDGAPWPCVTADESVFKQLIQAVMPTRPNAEARVFLSSTKYTGSPR